MIQTNKFIRSHSHSHRYIKLESAPNHNVLSFDQSLLLWHTIFMIFMDFHKLVSSNCSKFLETETRISEQAQNGPKIQRNHKITNYAVEIPQVSNKNADHPTPRLKVGRFSNR